MKVLLVDDEQKFALMLAKRLALRGIQAEVFFSGEKALSTVEQGSRFDVAVLDVKMPGIGGVELKRRLSGLDPRMKFVFLTGHGSGVDSAIGPHEAAETLPKPLKIEDLIETLNRLTEMTQNATGPEE
ncbi:response regulator [uncultured Desulfosarcina sp.]|uniref:response regulator n=1 Tax=uncultured Desulfosarcina sp. TaxID=218289 RepID=UPI0029C731DC|nr:response regulator [uncultured Desulfosarcina sp.]